VHPSVFEKLERETERKSTPTAVGGIATLYSHDPLASTLCFKDGKYGSVLKGNEIFNRCSHLHFGNFAMSVREDSHGVITELPTPEGLKLGIEGGEIGSVIDLGTEIELTMKYGHIISPGVAFASIYLSKGKLMILKHQDRQRKEFVELKEAIPLSQFTVTPESRSTPESSFSIKVGHIYLGRILDRSKKSFDLWVKILILAYSPGESVTLRWYRLSTLGPFTNDD
jgi:hypothetical protein